MLRILFCMLCLLLPCTAPAHAQSLLNRSDPLTRNLVLWWIAAPHQMGGTTWYPQIGRDRGTLSGMALTSTTSGWQSSTRKGAYGEMRFDGTDDVIGTGTTTLVAGLPAFTVCLWFRSTSTAVQQLYAETTGGGYPEMMLALFWGPSGQDISFNNYNGSGLGIVAPGFPAVPAASGQWQHLCGVQRSISSGEVWSNAWLAGANIGTITPTPTPDGRGLGFAPNESYRFTGALDDIRVYNRALSPNEIKQVYLDRPRINQPSPSYVAAFQILNKGLLPFFTSPR